jgi:hypothetical protein
MAAGVARMKRALMALLVATGLMVTVLPAPTAWADNCTFCGNELEAGTNPLNCPHCREIANQITRGNEKVWVLDFQQGQVRRVQLKDDTGGGDVEDYWILPYTLKNQDEHAHEFFLDITAESDKGNQTYRYHDVWIPDVYDEVAKILGVREGQQLLSQRDVCMPPPGTQNALPPVQDQRSKETGHLALPTIQPGETLRGVAIFGKFDPEMDRLTIKVRGLSTSSILTHDAYVAPDSQPNRRVITEAVLTLNYRRPGDEFVHGEDPLEFVDRRWTDETRTIGSDLR